LKFVGSLGEYKIIETEDGSLSLFSEAFNEGCHSSHGAATETRYIYVDGCEVKDRSVNCIFEVGFATGLGFIETAKVLDEFLFYSTELDEKLVIWANENNKIFDTFEKVGNNYIGTKGRAKAIILIGDARETIKNYSFDRPFQAIYQDAFSPKRNPTLWTKEWFTDLKELSSEEVILSTYSASSRVKKALFSAGWIVEEREGFAFKRSSTRGFLKGEHEDQLLKKLQNPKVLPYSDSEINT
jgi:tRNA U34 5-methylaminomethyl-2-thiouridine-forming methyltransferase MnmC